MSNYVKSVNFAAKDALPQADPNKTAKGTEVDTEFNNIATAITSKEDTSNKNVAGGYAGLNGSGLVDFTRLGLPVDATDNLGDATHRVGVLFATTVSDGATSTNSTLTTTGTFVLLASGSAWTALKYGGVGENNEIGFRGLPPNSQTGSYTTVLADRGKLIRHPNGSGAGDTYTINNALAYAIGDTISFWNGDSNSVSIALSSGTLRLAGTATTGTRTLAQHGTATALLVDTNEWVISGPGLS